MNIKPIVSLLLLATCTTMSCTKFLDRQPISSLTEENYYRNTAEVETGVYGAYAALRPVYNLDYILAGLRSDDSYISEAEGDMNQIDGFSEFPTNSFVASYWQTSYYAIRQCNTVLKYIDNVTDADKKKVFEGEMKFLRAHMYFNLVRLYGDVPLVTSVVDFDDKESYKRIPVATVYNQIIADFKRAVETLPPSWGSNEAARVTSGAAKGMLAKVYLTLKQYALARPLLQDLIDNPGPYTLQSSYKNIFGLNNEMNSEIMYAVRYKSACHGMGNTFPFNLDRLAGSPGFRSASDFRGSAVFPTVDSFRRAATFTIYLSNQGSPSYYNIGKYMDPGTLKYDGGADFIVLRYADILLMYAEVVNEMDGAPTSNTSPALVQFNRIRQRANPLAPALGVSGSMQYQYTATQVKTQDAFRTTIKLERRREFGIEDQRWYDLLRWNDAVTVMNTHFSGRNISTVVKPYQTLYPIPQREIDVSGHILTQNPGYE